MNRRRVPPARVVIEPIEEAASLESALVSFSCATAPAILTSSLQCNSYGRYSIFACDPADVFNVEGTGPRCPFQALGDHVAAYPAIEPAPAPLPFVGGWIGFFTYESGLTIERVECSTSRDLPLPALRFCLYDAAAVHDHQAGQWYLVAVDWPQPLARRRPTVATRLESLRTRLAEAARLDTNDPLPMPVTSTPIPNMSRESYLARVRKVKQYIAAGDTYQVNLTQRFTVQTNASPQALFQRLCRSNPSAYGAFIRWGRTAILSCSPELFLSLSDGHVVTRPIKGTRPRIGDQEADAAYKRELSESHKDRAELNMIIDLLRNDLGRVCSYGTVRVICADEIEEHPTVFHRVATIQGDLDHTHGWLDLLRAAFPGGSVTGAPKIRSMQIIDELEPTARGVYCGSIGIIGLDGSMSLNIAIRTMLQLGQTVHLYAGGGIVADSTPQDEYNEILAKAAGMLRALGCSAPCAMPLLQEVSIS